MVARIFLAFNAIVIALIGILYLLEPNLLLARYELETGSVGMDNMLRAAYGGIFVGASAVFFMGVLDPNRRRDALGFVAIFMSGAAVGRIASIVATGMPHPVIMSLLYYEAIAALIALTLYMRAAQPE